MPFPKSQIQFIGPSALVRKLHFPVGTVVQIKRVPLGRSREDGSRPNASEIPLKETAYFPPGDCRLFFDFVDVYFA